MGAWEPSGIVAASTDRPPRRGDADLTAGGAAGLGQRCSPRIEAVISPGDSAGPELIGCRRGIPDPTGRGARYFNSLFVLTDQGGDGWTSRGL
jgi:hypothetical protein